MQREEIFGRLRLVVIIALIVGMVGAISFLIYGFTFMWQVLTATLMSILLAIIAVFFVLLSIYMWIKNFLLKRKIKHLEEENIRISKNLKNCNTSLPLVADKIGGGVEVYKCEKTGVLLTNTHTHN